MSRNSSRERAGRVAGVLLAEYISKPLEKGRYADLVHYLSQQFDLAQEEGAEVFLSHLVEEWKLTRLP